jgi:hypothetical protein
VRASIGNMSTPETQVMKIGDLLVELGLVSQKDLNEALQIGKDTGLPIGRVLTMSAFLTESQFQAALKAQSLLKEGVMRMPAVKDAIEQVSNGTPVEEAFGNVGVAKEDAENEVKLGELLSKSGFVTSDQLDTALEKSKTTGLPLGRLLLMSGTISESLLTAALNAQIFVRDGRITKEQAVEGLKGVKRRHVPIEVSLAEKGLYQMPDRPTIRLGELLVQANVISNVEVMNAIEIGLINDKQMGEILLELDRIEGKMLNYALNLQGQVESGLLTPEQAIQGLLKAKERGFPKAQDAASSAPTARSTSAKVEPPSLVKFLKQVGRINDDNINTALQVAVRDNELIGKLLVSAEVLDPRSLQAANELRNLMETQSMSFDWATAAFQHCVTENVSVQQALQAISAKHRAIQQRNQESHQRVQAAASPVQNVTQSQSSLTPVSPMLGVTQSQSSLTPVSPILGVTQSQSSLPPVPPPMASLARHATPVPIGSVPQSLVAPVPAVTQSQSSLQPVSSGARYESQPTPAPGTLAPVASAARYESQPTPAPGTLVSLSSSMRYESQPTPAPGVTQSRSSLPPVPPLPSAPQAQPSAPPIQVIAQAQSQSQSQPIIQPVTQSQSALPPVPPPTPTNAPQKSPRATQSHPNGAVWDGVRKLGDEAFNAGNWPHAERRWTEAVRLAEPMGEGDPRYAYSLEKLAEVLINLKRYEHAEPLMLRAHTLKLKILGPEHLSVAATLNSLSKLYYFQGKYEQAEPLARQFVRLCERSLGSEHADVACGMHNLATLYHVNKRYDQAEEHYKRALAICRKTLGNEHSSTLRLLKSYAALLKTLNREAEAENLDAYAQGTITGSWKVISINSDQALHED